MYKYAAGKNVAKPIPVLTKKDTSSVKAFAQLLPAAWRNDTLRSPD